MLISAASIDNAPSTQFNLHQSGSCQRNLLHTRVDEPYVVLPLKSPCRQSKPSDAAKSSLVDMYAKCGLPDDAWVVFDGIVVKSPVSCTSMIYAYARSGRRDYAIAVFWGAPVRSLYSCTTLISGLVQSGKDIDAMESGRQVHGNVYVLGYNSCLFQGNALVDMYVKCSDIEAAMEIFDNLLHRDVVSWTTIIVGAAQHGRAEEALDLFVRMLLDGEYGIRPSLQQYTCLLDLLSCSGRLEEADKLLNEMPFQPD
ncbi:hypothetical protein MLD38_010977 [Melastoma candidum]|uniref:Uncharacterized protein n=1 Tax=Melastoma candidum TaxID=119954 RepID=A0ACB9R2Q8_9MYRT|nr:hypothetical protein MLD38_010977 [Melastoma candidum]